MEFNPRKENAFYNLQTGKWIPDSPITRSVYVASKKKEQFLLPLGVKYDGGHSFSSVNPTTQIQVEFRRVNKSGAYIIPTAGEPVVDYKTYQYSSFISLMTQIEDDLGEMNIEYDPSAMGGTDTDRNQEWFLSHLVDDIISNNNRLGYSNKKYSASWTFVNDDDTPPAPTEAPLFGGMDYSSIGFNGVTIDYRLEHFAKGYNQDRCGWNYLTNYGKIPFSVLKKFKNPSEDVWTLQEIIDIAKKRSKNLILLDMNLQPLRKYEKDGTFDDKHFQFLVDDPKQNQGGRWLIFVANNGHIYPLHPKYNLRFAKSLAGAATIADVNMGEIINAKADEQLTIREITQRYKGKKCEKKRNKLIKDARKREEDARDWIFVDGDWDYEKHFKKAKTCYVADATLAKIVSIIHEKTNCIYNIKSQGHNITQIYEVDEDFNHSWAIVSAPSHKLYATIKDKIKEACPDALVLPNTPFGQIGINIFKAMFGKDVMTYKSQHRLALPAERPYNHTTKLCETVIDENSEYIQRQNEIKRQKIKEQISKSINKPIPVNSLYENTTDVEGVSMDLRSLEGVSAIDIRKCYSSVLEDNKFEWCKFEPFDEIKKYEKMNETKLQAGIYLLQLDEEPDDLYIPLAELEVGNSKWVCPALVKHAKLHGIKYTLTHQLLAHRNNRIQANEFKEFVDYCYKTFEGLCFGEPLCGKGCGECVSKLIVNSFIGMFGRSGVEQVVCNNSFIMENPEEIVYAKYKGLTITYLPIINTKLALCSEHKRKSSPQSWMPIHRQILQQAKLKLQNLYDSIKWTENYEEELNDLAPHHPSFTPIEDEFLSFNKWCWSLGKGILPMAQNADYRAYKEKYEKDHAPKVVKLVRNNAIPLLFKTDCIVLAECGGDLRLALKNVDFGKSRGQIRTEWTSTKDDLNREKLENSILSNFRLKCINEETISTKTQNLLKESEKHKIDELIRNNEGFVLNGMAGTGKSTMLVGKGGIIESILKYNKTYVLTAPTHKATHNQKFIEEGVESQTIHSFLGLRVGSPAPSDPFFQMCIGLNYLLIDECSMIDKNMFYHLIKIKSFYPKLGIGLIGDPYQLPPVEIGIKAVYTRMSKLTVVKELTDYNRILLKINHRSSVDGEAMFKLFNDILSQRYMTNPLYLKLIETPDEFGNVVNRTHIHLCWTNHTADKINNMFRDIMRKHPDGHSMKAYYKFDKKTNKLKKYTLATDIIWVNCRIIVCKTDKDSEFYNNQEFKIKSWTDKQVTIMDNITKIEYIVDNEVLENFKYSFAMTINKAQGSSIDEKFMIWDWYKRGFSTPLKYTAVSRATKSENVKICSISDHTSLDWLCDKAKNLTAEDFK